MSCMYKLFMGTMAQLLTKWSINTGILLEETQLPSESLESCIHYDSLLLCLAYADDLVIIGWSKNALLTLLDVASEEANILSF